jgi:hypothetical protein
MYECTECGEVICLVCRDSCHPYCPWERHKKSPSCASAPSDGSTTDMAALSARTPMPTYPAPASRQVHVLRPLGFVPGAYCHCEKTTCRAISDIDPREAAGYTWTPNPIDTSSVTLKFDAGSELGKLVDKLACNSHEVRSPFLVLRPAFCCPRDRRITAHAPARTPPLFPRTPYRCGPEIASLQGGSGGRNAMTAKSCTLHSWHTASFLMQTSSGILTLRSKQFR